MYHGTEYAPDQDRTIDLLEFRTTSFLGCLHNVAYATYELDDNPVEDTLCLMSRSGAPLSGAGDMARFRGGGGKRGGTK